MAQKPETVFRKRVMRDLKTLPETAIFPIQQKTISGDPDLILCVNSIFVALELKSEKGTVSKLQRYKLDKVMDAGGVALTCKPNEWPTIFERLKNLTRS